MIFKPDAAGFSFNGAGGAGFNFDIGSTHFSRSNTQSSSDSKKNSSTKYKEFFRQKSEEIQAEFGLENGDDVNLIGTNRDSNNETISNINTTLGIGGVYAEFLRAYALENSTLVYKYGTAEINALEFTLKNTRRMLNVAKYAKWAGYSAGLLSIYINHYQYREAVKNNDKLGQDKARMEAIANGAIMYGGPIGWGIGAGLHISLFLNPTMKPVELYVPDYTKTCFVAGTKVLMEDGSSKNIEDIVVGDKILSVNIETMEIEADQVLIVPVKEEKYNKIYMEYDNGFTNISSAHHPFFVKGKGWSVYDVELAKKDITFDISQIELGDIVYYFDNGALKETKIIKLENQQQEALMYNIKYVKNNNTFFANGILVHNRYVD